jgi:PAS domain S-box-containing protein
MIFKRKIRSIIIGTIIIAVLVFAFVIIEFYESRNELLNTLKNESMNLNEALSLSFENTLITSEEVESQIISKMNAVAALVIHIDFKSKQNRNKLLEILNSFQIDHISIINRNGNVVVNSDTTIKIQKVSNQFLNELKPLFNGEQNWIDFGIINNEVVDKKMYLISGIGSKSNECVLVGLSSEKILDFRKKVGIGNQIQKIADNPDILYILLQDNDGIISASKGMKEMLPIESDNFLMKAYNSEETMTRSIDYNGKKVFESVKTVNLNDGTKILNRIGLSLDNIRAIQQRSMRRVVLIGVGIFILFSILYAFLMTRKGFSELKKEHKIIKSYTDLVLENMADAVIAVNKDNKIAYLNKTASEIFGISNDLSVGQDYNNTFVEDQLLINYSKVLKHTLINKDITFTNNENSKRNLELSVSFVLDNNDSIDLTIAIIKDMTDKMNLQHQVERKEKLSAMGELAAGVAHEIRNPLNSINIITQRIQKEFEPKEDFEDYNKLLSIVRSEVRRVNNIIKQFLEYASPPKLQIGNYSINDVLDESISIIESEAILKHININKDYKENLSIDIDKEKIKQVFINLLRNSIDAVDTYGYITCAVKLNNQGVEISINDNGTGIPDDLKSKIFNLYFTTKQSGTGLGLSIVHQIISEHNGLIEVDSMEGKGTTFRIVLPLFLQNPSTIFS